MHLTCADHALPVNCPRFGECVSRLHNAVPDALSVCSAIVQNNNTFYACALAWHAQHCGSRPRPGSACPCPILFYTGNESPVTDYWDNSGFIVDVLAEQLGASVFFVEHRYFGDSLPFGDKSFDGDNISFLSAEQALADYAHFLDTLQREVTGLCPVFSFGGSYGGAAGRAAL